MFELAISSLEKVGERRTRDRGERTRGRIQLIAFGGIIADRTGPRVLCFVRTDDLLSRGISLLRRCMSGAIFL